MGSAFTRNVEIDEGADLPGYTATQADQLIKSVYGDHIHQNDATHLDGGISDDSLWQSYWRQLVGLPLKQYRVPNNSTGRAFIRQYADELKGITNRQWNSERPAIFTMVVLQMAPEKHKQLEVSNRIHHRLTQWQEGNFAALVGDVVRQLADRRLAQADQHADPATVAKKFNSLMLNGRVKHAADSLLKPEQGKAVLHPNDTDEKTGLPVLEVLQDKHPDNRDPAIITPDDGTFETYPEAPAPIPLVISDEILLRVAQRLRGSGGPDGVDAPSFTSWLTDFRTESVYLRGVVRSLIEWLSNSSPPAASIRAINACRTSALNKFPGTRPLGVGCILRRFMCKCVLLATGQEAAAACGNLNLCAGIPAGIEGAVHAVRRLWENLLPDDVSDSQDDFLSQDDAGASPFAEPNDYLAALDVDPPPNPPDPGDDTPAMDRESTADPPGVLLVDARNGFNELNRKCMLWTIRHLWPSAARFSYNLYRHQAILVVRRCPDTATFLLSREGVTQGCPLAMVHYGLALVPLARRIRDATTGGNLIGYADDKSFVGTASQIDSAMQLLLQHGPPRGYFPEPDKSTLICRPQDQATMQQLLHRYQFQYKSGSRYLGGFIGDDDEHENWLKAQVSDWVEAVRTLSTVAQRFPQTAYACMQRSLQAQWQYLQRVTPTNFCYCFQPLEDAIRKDFLPALLSVDAEAITALTRSLFALPVRFGGLGLPDPTATHENNYKSSIAATRLLVDSLCANENLDFSEYRSDSGTVHRANRSSSADLYSAQLDLIILRCTDRAMSKHMALIRDANHNWLTAMPSLRDGTELSRLEFLDSLRVRYRLEPLNLPSTCDGDGCGQPNTARHAMCCKKGGLITHRHDELKFEWAHLCSQAFQPSRVSDEPLIHLGQPTRAQGSSGANTPPKELRGDVAVTNFWTRERTTIFDIQVVCPHAAAYAGRTVHSLLKRAQEVKKSKYLQACLDQRRDFTPLVLSTEGTPSPECDRAIRRLAVLLSQKWDRPYSETCSYVRARISVSLARSLSRCLRCSRAKSDPRVRNHISAVDSGPGLRMYQARQ